MKRTALCLVLALLMATTACSPIEQQARNTAAALQGAISAAQTQYLTSCTANPKQTACVTINQAIDGQAALITAVTAYCGWSPTAPPANGSQTCVPVKTASAGLQTAINNASLFIAELKSLITAGGAQ